MNFRMVYGLLISMHTLIIEYLSSTDHLTDFTYTLIHMEKEFAREEEGSILNQFTPEHFLHMLSDFYEGRLKHSYAPFC